MNKDYSCVINDDSYLCMEYITIFFIAKQNC